MLILRLKLSFQFLFQIGGDMFAAGVRYQSPSGRTCFKKNIAMMFGNY